MVIEGIYTNSGQFYSSPQFPAVELVSTTESDVRSGWSSIPATGLFGARRTDLLIFWEPVFTLLAFFD